MRNIRCPWCGKKIDPQKDRKNKMDRHNPHYFIFAQCGHCNKYYGQTMQSRHAMCCFLAVCLVLVAAYVLEIGYIAFLSLIFIFLSLLSPIEKIDEKGYSIKTKTMKFEAFLISPNNTVSRGQLYFLDDMFDERTPFSSISPIYITSYNKKSNKIKGHFLYDQDMNNIVFDKDSVPLYDSNMKLVSSIKFDIVTDKKT